MKTVREHIASQPGIPAPPPGATHVLVWEPYGSSWSQWVLGRLDDIPDDEAVGLFGGSPAASHAELAGFAAGVLGGPVALSARFEAEGEFGYYVTLAGGGR